MAGNIAGMFQMINQAVKANPIAGQAGQQLLGGASQGIANAVSNAPGFEDVSPMSMMNDTGKQMEATKQLAQLDLSTVEDKMKAAQIYGQLGAIDKQLAMAQAAEKQRLEQIASAKQQKLRESYSNKARKLGLDDYADQINSGATDLEEDAKVLNKQQMEDLALKRGESGKRVLLRRAGYTDDEISRDNLASLPFPDVKELADGEKAAVKGFTDKDGKQISRKVNSFGKVWDKETQSYMNASDLDLSPSVNTQKVLDASTTYAKEFAKAGVEEFVSLHEKANNAQLQLDNITRSLGYLEAMPTGALVDVHAFALKVGATLGMETEDIVNYETYIAEAGKRVAEQIKAFGSGTGLSDADREYAKLISAADPRLRAESLKRLLRIQEETMQQTVNIYQDVKGKTRDNMGEDGYMVDTFQLRAPGAGRKLGGKLNPTTGKIEWNQ